MATVGGNNDNTALLMNLLMQIQERRRQQAANLISTLQPGQALASLTPDDPKKAVRAFQRVTGVKADPSRVIVPHTIESAVGEEQLAAFQGLTPGQRRTLATNRTLNSITGQTGARTIESVEAEQQTETSRAQARRDVVQAGARRIAATPPEQLGAAGERQILGETGTEARATEERARSTELVSQHANRFLADPTNSQWGRFLERNGLDPVAITEAFASGQDSLLQGFMQLRVAEAANAGELQNEIEKARIRVAETVAERTNGALPVRTQLALEQALESGEDIYDIGVPSETVNMWLKVKELSVGAVLREAIAKDNPQARLLEQYLKNMKDFSNLDQMGAANTVAAQMAALSVTAQELGTRPGPEDPEKRAVWDARARLNYSQIAIIGKRPESWLGIGFLDDDETDVIQLPGFLQPGFAADTTGSGESPRRVMPNPMNPNDTTGAGRSQAQGPRFFDPSAAAAVSGALNIGTDTTFRRGGSGTGPGFRGQGTGTRADSTTTSWMRTASVGEAVRRLQGLPEAQWEAQMRILESIRGSDFHDEVAANTPAE